jgi:threonine dehydratase
MMRLPEFSDVKAAYDRIEGFAVRTPLLENTVLNERVGGRVLIKPEILQRTGSFKFRGAFSALRKFSGDQKRGGVVAFSSGNHAQGIAEAARILKMPALVVMPSDAPSIKKKGVIDRGGEIIEYLREDNNREALAAELCKQRGATLIPAFEHSDVISGQGTAGLEAFSDLEARDITADQLVCCLGGGGLMAGIGLSRDALSPNTRLIGAEPTRFDDHKRSLRSGVREVNASMSGSICDAIMAPSPGEMTWAINRGRLSDVALCSDDDVKNAMRFAFEILKLIVEPGGAAALACILNGSVETKDRTSVVVLTGGNVDPALFASVIEAR